MFVQRKLSKELLIFVMIIFICVISIGCSSENDGKEKNGGLPEATSTQGAMTNSVTSSKNQINVALNPNSTEILSLGKGEIITPYYDINKVTHPCIAIDEKLYLIRNYPEPLPEDLDHYWLELRNVSTEIEVYNPKNISKGFEVINLQNLDNFKSLEYRLSYHQLLYSNGKFYLLLSISENETSRVKYLYIFNEDGSYINRILFTDDWQFMTGKAVVIGDIVFITRQSFDENRDNFHQIYSVNTITGEVSLISNEFYAGMSKYNDENLIIMDRTPKEYRSRYHIELYLYNINNGEITLFKDYGEVIFEELWKQIDNIEYSIKHNNIYIATTEDIYRLSLDTGEFANVYNTGILAHWVNDILIFENDMIMITYTETRIFPNFKETKTGDMDKTFLFVLGQGYGSQSMSNMFEAPLRKLENDGSTINLMPFSRDFVRNDQYNEILATKLMAGDTDFDLFFVDKGQYKLLNEIYYADFRENEALAKSFDNMLPGIKELSEINGKLCLAPIDIFFNAFEYNTAVAADADIPADLQPSIINNFITFLRDNKLKLNDRNIAPFAVTGVAGYTSKFFETYVTNFMNHNAEKDELKQLINDFITLYEEKLVVINPDGKTPSLLKDSRVQSTKEFPDNSYFAVPRYNENALYNVDISALAVNPNSPNKEKALKFLQYVMDEEINTERNLFSYEIGERGHDHENDGEHEHNHMIGVFNALYDYSFLSDIQEFSYYKYLLQNSVRAIYEYDISYSFSIEMNNYFNGSATINEITDKIYRMLEMIRDE